MTQCDTEVDEGKNISRKNKSTPFKNVQKDYNIGLVLIFTV